MTEKFFQPLIAGSVPIYRGTPNIDDFAPAADCYVNADDYSSAAELVEFLCSRTDEEYDAFHRWRREGPSLEWQRRFAAFETPTFIRLTRAVKAVAIGRRLRSQRGTPAGL